LNSNQKYIYQLYLETNMRRPCPFQYTDFHPDHYYEPSNSLDRYYSNFLPQYKRKQQRRQAAAIVVESLWNNGSNNDTSTPKSGGGTARKSTAQPRPKLIVQPRGIGPIADPNVNDVLCGRGGRINSHAGNIQFRDIIHSKKKDYLAPTTKKLAKAHIAAGVVNDIRTMNPPGRFLKEEKGTGMWYDIGDAKAIKKTGQALREDAPDIRPAIDVEGGSSGDERKVGATKTVGNTGMVKSSAKSSDIPPSVAISPRGSQRRRGSNETERTQTLIHIMPQQYGIKNGAQRQTPDYQGQMSMPPPYVHGGNSNAMSSSQQQFLQQQSSQGFQTRNIPLQVPLGARSSFPDQPHSGGRSGTSKFGSSSRKAMEALSQAGAGMQQQHQYSGYGGQPSDDPFGYFDPNNPQHMSDDITISTISGLSEPVSSLTFGRPSGASDLMGSSGRPSSGTSDLMNMSVKSNFSLTDSLRLGSTFKRSSHQYNAYEQMMNASFKSGSNKSYDPMMNASFKSGSNKSYDPMMIVGLGGSVRSGFGGSLTRSNSFPDNMNSDSFRFDDDEGKRRPSSAMSIGSIMDMQSDASSTQWFQAAVGNLPNPDDKSFLSSSIMSADLDALDLASTF